MALTYSPSLRLTLIGSGDQSGTWGTTTNANLSPLIDQAIAGVATIVVYGSSDYTLSVLNGATDEARQMVLYVTGTLTGAINIIVPNVDKLYVVVNATAGGWPIYVKPSVGSIKAQVPYGTSALVYCDSVGVYLAVATPELVAGTGITITGTSAVPTITNTGVTTFNTRSGPVTLSSSDVTTALTYTPPTPTGTGATGTWPIAITNGVYNNIAQSITGTLTISAGSIEAWGAGGNSSTFAGGRDALANNSGLNNTALGFSALYYNSSGAENTGIGSQASYNNLVGARNVAIGRNALLNNKSSWNTAVGAFAATSLNGVSTYSLNNTAVGYLSLASATSANNCTAIGSNALYNATGDNNIALGYNAGSLILSGSSNVCIGISSTTSTTSVSNEVNISNNVTQARFQGAAVAWTFTSDQRDKTAIEDLPVGLGFINKLQPRKYQWDFRHTDIDKGKESVGFIAQELLAVVEETNTSYIGLVDTNDPNQYTIATTNLIPILVNAVKELSVELDTLKTLIALKG